MKQVPVKNALNSEAKCQNEEIKHIKISGDNLKI